MLELARRNMKKLSNIVLRGDVLKKEKMVKALIDQVIANMKNVDNTDLVGYIEIELRCFAKTGDHKFFDNAMSMFLNYDAMIYGKEVDVVDVRASRHFFQKGAANPFSLTAVLKLGKYVEAHKSSLPRNKELEFTTEDTTIVYSVDKKGMLHLVTGWVGQRKRVKRLFKK